MHVGANDNGSFDEQNEKVLDTNAVDDVWSAGHVGLFPLTRAGGEAPGPKAQPASRACACQGFRGASTLTHEFDDLKVWIDDAADSQLDDQQIDDVT